MAALLESRKRIPVAAGLGGGSSTQPRLASPEPPVDGCPPGGAAAALSGLPLGGRRAVFLGRGAAVGRGIGADLSPLSLPPYNSSAAQSRRGPFTRSVSPKLDLAKSPEAPLPPSWDPEHPTRT